MADISLLFDVATGGNPSGDSEALIRSQLEGIVSNINSNPFSIKFQADEESLKQFQKRVSEVALTLGTNTSTSSTGFTQVARQIDLTAAALHTMNSAVNATNLDKISSALSDMGGVSVSVGAISDIISRLESMSVTLTDARVQFEDLGKTGERIPKLIIEGVDAAGNSIRRSLRFDNKGELERDLTDIAIKLAEIDRQSKTTGSSTGVAGEQAADKFAQAKKAVTDYYNALTQLNRLKLMGTAIGQDKDTGQWVASKAGYDERVAQLNRLQQAYDAAITSSKNFTASELEAFNAHKTDRAEKYRIAVENITNAEKKRQETQRSVVTITRSYDETINRCEKNLKDWSAAEHSRHESSRDAYKAFVEEIKATKSAREAHKNNAITLEEYTAQVDKLKTSHINTKKVLQDNGDAAKTFGERISGLAKKFTQWLGVSQIIIFIYKNIKKMISTVKDLDTAMTELRKVTDETEERYTKFLDNATQRAKTLGATLADTITATADFARLGYNIEDAEKLADAAIVYKNVGEGIEDINTASESIIATMQAFGIGVEDAMLIVDKFNEVGNNYAINSVGIGEALLRSAAAMNAANNSLDETIALATAANTIIQNPETVGTTLKTVSMYLRAAKTEADEAGESTDGMASSVSELREELLKLTGNKVDIQVDENKFKSTYEILKELSAVWDSLSDITQANITELVGGKRNSNVVSALLENFAVAEESLRTSSEAAGSALAENEKYLDSIEGKIAIFKSSFEELSQNVIDSEFVKIIVDAGTKLLSCLNPLAKFLNIGDGILIKLAAIATVIHIISKQIVKWGGGVSTVLKLFDKLSPIINNTSSVVAGFFNGMNNALTPGVTAMEVFNAGLEEAFGKVGLLSVKIAALIAILYAAYKAWDYFTITTKEATEAVDEAITELNQNTNDLEGAEKRLAEIGDRIRELNNIDTPTLTEKSELETLQQESAELQAQIHLLKEKNEILNKDKKAAEEQAWETANKVGIGKAYNEWGEMSTFEYLLSRYAEFVLYTQESEPDTFYSGSTATSAVDAANIALEKRNEYLKEYNDLQKKINNNTATEYEKNRFNTLKNEISVLETSLVGFIDIFEKCGDSGKGMWVKISLSLKEPTERLLAFKEILDTIFKNKSYSATDIFNLYGKDGYETLTAYIDALIALGQIDLGDDKVLDASDLEQVVQEFSSIANEAEGAAGKVNKLGDAISTVSSAISSLDSASSIGKTINSIIGSLANGNGLQFDDLSSISEQLTELGLSTDVYIEKIIDAKNSSADMQKVFGEITSAIVSQKIASGELTEADEELLAVWLESIGVANASEVAHKALGVDKDLLAETEAKLANVTEGSISTVYEEVGALMAEQGATSATKQALFELALQKMTVNNNKIDTADEIKQVIALANAALAGEDALNKLNNALAWVESGQYGPPSPEISETLKSLEDGSFAINALDPNDFIITSTGNGSGGSSGSGKDSGGDSNLDAWEKLVDEKKHLVEMDKITQEEYYNWLASEYKAHLSDTEKYADELMSIEKELYDWEKQRIQSNIDDELAVLDNKRTKGIISEEEYFKELDRLYSDGYSELQQAVEEHNLYGVDNTERLQAETEFLENVKDAHNSAYDAEKKALDHHLAMNLISEEQYLIELERLYDEYYRGQEMYSDEAMELEEELYDKRVELVEKWADAAVEAIEAMADATEGMIDAIKDLIQDSIDTNEENFNLEKSSLEHALAMNYISEEQYYSDLEKLYKRYFKDKNLYMEQYWENQEEVYQHEQDMLENSASAIEDIHAKVVELIKQELEDAIDAIEETKDKYLDLIEIRRKAMNEMKDEDDYEKERAEKLSSISELQRQLNALAYDTSAEGVAKYKQIYAELQEAQKELAEFENDRAYEKMNDQLDKESEGIEIKYDGQTEELENLLDNNEYLVDEAWARLNDKNSDLYNQLIEYNKKYSTSIKDDITGSWESATKALQDYADAKNGYMDIVGQIGQPGMTDAEYKQFQLTTEGKQIYNWVKVALDFGSSMLSIGGGLLSSFMGIAGSLMPGLPGSLLSTGSGLVSTFAGLGSSILGVLGSFAGGTDYVPKTGIYRTDELGEELKLLHLPSGDYTLLTEGSKVFTSEQTQRLVDLINSSGSLFSNISGLKIGTPQAGLIPNVQNSNQNLSVQNVFQIQSSDPKGVAAEVEKLMPKIAEYTAGRMVNSVGNIGIKRLTQKMV